MTNSAIARVLNNVNKSIQLGKTDRFYNTSFGFHRLSALPQRVKRAYDLAANLESNWDGRKALENQVAFLGGLTNDEFINWLKIA